MKAFLLHFQVIDFIVSFIGPTFDIVKLVLRHRYDRAGYFLSLKKKEMLTRSNLTRVIINNLFLQSQRKKIEKIRFERRFIFLVRVF